MSRTAHPPIEPDGPIPALPTQPDAPLFAELRSRLARRPRRRVQLEGFRSASVLIPLLLRPGNPQVVFVQRVRDGSIHSGQVAFPGGGVDPGDASPEDTALREAEEEVNLPRARVRVLGRMDDNATVSRYVVTPVVALVTEPVELMPQPEEVEIIFEVPLTYLLDPAHERRAGDVEFLGRRFALYEYQHGGHRIWGITGRMLHEFLEVLRPLVAVRRAGAGGGVSEPGSLPSGGSEDAL